MYTLLTKPLGFHSMLFPLWKFVCVLLNVYCYCTYELQRGSATACWFWGKRGSAEITLLLHCFPSPWMTCGGMQFLTQGISLCPWSSGLVCDRIRALLLIHQIDVICMQAHTNTLRNKNGGGENKGVKKREMLIWKQTNKQPWKTCILSRKDQGTAGTAPAPVCRSTV